MYNDKPTNGQIRTIYAPGYSYLMLSYFRTNLTLNFVPYIGQDNTGKSEYCNNTHLSTSINHEGAAFFYLQATSILDGKDTGKQIETVLPCNNGTTLTFEYKPGENNQMNAYIAINKNNQTILFRFPTTEYQEIVDGQTVTKVMQTGLGTFALILVCYIAGRAAIGSFDRYGEALERLQEEERDALTAIGNTGGC